MVQLNPKAFRETPLCELPLEEALKVGARRSEELKPTEFIETSIRFCIPGLRNWLKSYVNNYCDSSIYKVAQCLIWHWASYCENNEEFIQVRRQYDLAEKEIIEGSSYVDLAERITLPARVKEFTRTTSYPLNLAIPQGPAGIIGRTSDALGISTSKLIQVGLAWSLSTNSRGLYKEWVQDTFAPIWSEVLSLRATRNKLLEETLMVFSTRITTKQQKEEDARIEAEIAALQASFEEIK